MFIKYFNLFRKCGSLGFVLLWQEGQEAGIAGWLACSAQGPPREPRLPGTARSRRKGQPVRNDMRIPSVRAETLRFTHCQKTAHEMGGKEISLYMSCPRGAVPSGSHPCKQCWEGLSLHPRTLPPTQGDCCRLCRWGCVPWTRVGKWGHGRAP